MGICKNTGNMKMSQSKACALVEKYGRRFEGSDAIEACYCRLCGAYHIRKISIDTQEVYDALRKADV